MIDARGSELDSVLRELFPLAGKRNMKGVKPYSLPALPSVESAIPRGAMSPGVTIGPDGLPVQGPPPAPVEVRLGDQAMIMLRTLLNRQMQHAAPPAHQAPPLNAEQIDIFSKTPVSVPGGGYGAGPFTTLATYTVPDSYNAVIVAAGQLAEFPAAYQGMQWRIRVDAKAHKNYSDIENQLFQYSPPGTVIFIPLRSAQTVDIQAGSLSTTTYNAWGRLMGWQWPTIYLEGESLQGNTVG